MNGPFVIRYNEFGLIERFGNVADGQIVTYSVGIENTSVSSHLSNRPHLYVGDGPCAVP